MYSKDYISAQCLKQGACLQLHGGWSGEDHVFSITFV